MPDFEASLNGIRHYRSLLFTARGWKFGWMSANFVEVIQRLVSTFLARERKPYSTERCRFLSVTHACIGVLKTRRNLRLSKGLSKRREVAKRFQRRVEESRAEVSRMLKANEKAAPTRRRRSLCDIHKYEYCSSYNIGVSMRSGTQKKPLPAKGAAD